MFQPAHPRKHAWVNGRGVLFTTYIKYLHTQNPQVGYYGYTAKAHTKEQRYNCVLPPKKSLYIKETFSVNEPPFVFGGTNVLAPNPFQTTVTHHPLPGGDIAARRRRKSRRKTGEPSAARGRSHPQGRTNRREEKTERPPKHGTPNQGGGDYNLALVK